MAHHHRRLRRWWVAAVLINMVTMTGCMLAIGLGGRGAAAISGMVALVALPLLAVAPVLARFAAPGGRRRHRVRPGAFPGR